MQARASGFGRTEAADEMSRRFFGFSRFLVRRVVVHFHQLAGFWKVRGLSVGDDRAQFPALAASVPGVIFAKRGWAWASCLCAC